MDVFCLKTTKKREKRPFFTYYIDLAKMEKRETLLGWMYYFKKGGVFDQLRHPKGNELFPEPVERNDWITLV